MQQVNGSTLSIHTTYIVYKQTRRFKRFGRYPLKIVSILLVYDEHHKQRNTGNDCEWSYLFLYSQTYV